MLAKYQGIIFEAEKVADLPAYHLTHNKIWYGTVYLDSQIFSRIVIEGETLEDAQFLRHPMEGTFEIINYDIVTKEWIEQIMNAQKLDVSQISQIAGVTESTIYRILKGGKGSDISGSVKSSLFNFFNK